MKVLAHKGGALLRRRPASLSHAATRLRSEKGASFLLALAVFFVCAMVAASIVASASANAQKASGIQTAQQSYLTITSAARLLADDFDSQGYAATGSVRAPQHTCAYPGSHASDSAPEASFAVTDSTGEASSSVLAQLLAEGVAAINPNDPNALYVRNFTVKVDQFSDVAATFTMFGADGAHDVYDVQIELRSTLEKAPAAVIVTSKASTATEVVSSVDSGTCLHYDQWEFDAPYDQQALLDPAWANEQTPAFDTGSGNYVAIDTAYGHALATSAPVRDTTSEQTVSWGRAYVSKGQVQ